jgi:hypothetical protein
LDYVSVYYNSVWFRTKTTTHSRGSGGLKLRPRVFLFTHEY